MTRRLDAFRRVLCALAGAIAIILMLVAFVDVFGRYFLAQPLPGGHVLVQCLVCLLVFTGLPIVVLHDAHLRVRLLDRKMTPNLRRWRDTAVSCLIAACLVMLAGQLVWQARYFGANGEYLESIRIPLSWVAWYAAAATSVAALLAIARLQAGRDRGDSPR